MSVLVCGLLLFSMASCHKAISISIDDLTNALKSADIYKDDLSKVDNQVALASYEIDKQDVKDAHIYFSTGATPEEIAVIECSDEKGSTSRVMDALTARIKDQKESFEDYIPAEVKKLDHAIVIQQDHYAILCVANDSSKAKEIIKKYLSE